MKKIYEHFFNLCSKENQKKIKEFQQACENDKYYEFKNQNPLLFLEKQNYQTFIGDNFFEIEFSKDIISFNLKSTFNDIYILESQFFYYVDEKTYTAMFIIKNNSNESDEMYVHYSTYKNNLFIVDKDDNLHYVINSKENKKSNAEFYIFENINAMEFIFDNFLEPDILKDFFLLHTDIKIENDEIISSIINQSKFIKENAIKITLESYNKNN